MDDFRSFQSQALSHSEDSISAGQFNQIPGAKIPRQGWVEIDWAVKLRSQVFCSFP